jgi:hypothetical protein
MKFDRICFPDQSKLKRPEWNSIFNTHSVSRFVILPVNSFMLCTPFSGESVFYPLLLNVD